MTVIEARDRTVRDVAERLTGDGFTARVLVSDLNARVEVQAYRAEEPTAMAAALEDLALDAGVDKVFVKARASHREALESAGMCAEAVIEGYFDGRPAVVLSSFLSDERRRRHAARRQQEILAEIHDRPADPSLQPMPDGYRLVRARPEDAADLGELYGHVFRSYPFPIDDPDYVVSTMQTNVIYRLVRDPGGAVVAAASAETDAAHRNAEMTDFATLPEQRGAGLAQHLLAALEVDMDDLEIPNLYTIARARSAGMNRVFRNRGYRRTGTLVNNCHIAGQFEDMHVWCKQLPSDTETSS
jgi:putative beta-lysine N-acetyltransferase